MEWFVIFILFGKMFFGVVLVVGDGFGGCGDWFDGLDV